MLEAIRAFVTEEERQFLCRQITGGGGFQRLLERLQDGLRGKELTVTIADSRRVIRYASEHGTGGYQERLRSLAERLAPLVPPEAKTGSLFGDDEILPAAQGGGKW